MDLGAFGIWWSGWQVGDGVEESAAELEELGYGAIWLSGGFKPGLSGRFERLLGATTRAKVASGIINTWLTPAVELATATQELEMQFPGRFLLGLGVSHAPLIESAGRSYERPFSQVVGFLDELDAARPTVPKDRRILAALGRRMLGLAAERSLGAHPYFVTVEHTVLARQVLGEGPLLAPEVAVVLSTEAAEARQIARGYMAGYLTLPNYVNNLRRTGWTEADVSDGGSDRLLDALVPWGSAETVAGRLREHRAAGADHVCVQVIGADGTFPLGGYRQLASALGLSREELP
ncbi:MAG: LLM class F420-dependent oxidoreductase [Acidimicrobiales bacterium]|jgi:probable F420-dependent oxidoreductase